MGLWSDLGVVLLIIFLFARPPGVNINNHDAHEEDNSIEQILRQRTYFIDIQLRVNEKISLFLAE